MKSMCTLKQRTSWGTLMLWLKQFKGPICDDSIEEVLCDSYPFWHPFSGIRASKLANVPMLIRAIAHTNKSQKIIY